MWRKPGGFRRMADNASPKSAGAAARTKTNTSTSTSSTGECSSIRIDVAPNVRASPPAPAQPQTPLVANDEFPLLGDIEHIRSYSGISDASTASVRTIPALPGMQIRCHGIDANGLMFDCSSKEALRGAKRGKGHFWIDIDADERDADELRAWLGDLHLPLFFLSVIAERSETWATQVVPFKESALTIVRFLPKKESADTETHLAALSLPNLLMTFTSAPRSEAGDLYATLHDYMHGEERLPSPTASGVLLALLRFHIDRTSRSMRKLRRHVLKVDEIMDRNVAQVHVDSIIDAKDQLLRLLACAEEQDECLVALERAESDTKGIDFTDLKGSLGVLIATTSATERMALRLEKQIVDLRQRYENHQQEKINRRLAVLTVVSAVFLPLTLFSSIWGMNFSYMPELQSPYGYFLALFLMLCTASSMMFYFWRSGWFD